MKVYDAQSLRNVALVGHSGAGKTQLLSALLFDAGAVNRLGRVDDGTTVTDYDEEEIARKHTLSASLAYVEWNRTKINFIDTPGMANFLSDARAALRVSDAALVVVDAVSGVQVSTEKVWSLAAEMEAPRLVVLNRLDRERASLSRALDSLRGVFGRTVIPIQIPIGEEKDFRGVVDLVAMKGWTFRGRRQRQGVGSADSRRPRVGGAGRARRAHRDGRGSRRCADGEVLRVRDPRRRTSSSTASSAAWPPGASSRSSARRRRRTSACSRCSTPSFPTCRRRRSGRSAPRPRASEDERRREGRGQRAGRGLRLEDRRRSVRRTDHDVPGHLRHREGGLDGAEHHAGDAPSGSAT